MNLNYMIGKACTTTRDFVLRHRPPVLWQRYPRGYNFPMDLARFTACRPIQMVFDVGANDGGTAMTLAQWFPTATIHSFEPVQATYQSLQQRTRKYSRVITHQVACGSEAGRCRIQLKSHSTINSLVGALPLQNDPQSATDPQSENNFEEISIVSIDEFCHEHGISSIDLLKTDTEGFDVEVLQGAEAMLRSGNVRFIYTEVGFQGQTCQTPFDAVSEHLKARGYSLCGFYESARSGKKRELLTFSNALFIRTH